MGFAVTGDAFCLMGDLELKGVMQCLKVVDNTLLYNEDYFTFIRRVSDILARCRPHEITFNSEKFLLAPLTVSFCGNRLSHDCIAADQKISAVTDFVTPANLTDLRPLMGLVNQLADFTPDISSAAAPLRPLMSPRRTFMWNANPNQVKKHCPVHLSSLRSI